MTWAERMQTDQTLRDFVDAEIARAHVELQALRAEHQRDRDTIEAQEREIKDLRARVAKTERR